MAFLGLISLLAFYLAWNLGANDVANAMGTSVGSKAITLRQALVIAGVLEFTGAVLFGRTVTATLTTGVVNPDQFAGQPQLFVTGMVAVLLASGLWLQLATWRGWPVASSHATVGAIAGFSWVAMGAQAVNWTSVGTIGLSWLLTPLISGAIAALLYTQVKRWILEAAQPLQQLDEWIPWLSSLLLSIFGVIVLPTVLQPVQLWLETQWHWGLPLHDLQLGVGAIAAIALTLTSWRRFHHQVATSEPSAQPLKLVEQQLGKFQVLSACFVAFAHGSNDVGNAVAPLAAIATIHATGSLPLGEFQVPLWVLVLGGVGLVLGLAIWGRRVMATVGEGIIPLQPSSGFCAELAAATTILIASRLGLPVSTTHALVGGVVGIGLIQGWESIQLGTVRQIALAWLITVPIAMGLSAGLFAIIHL